jgi:hypothetical protein
MCVLCVQLNTRPSALFGPHLLFGITETLRSMMSARPQTSVIVSKPLLATPAEVLGVRIPDSDVAVAAMDLAQAAMRPVLLNHCLRTFVLGMIDARKRVLQIDEEAAFVGSILHDIALVPEYAGDLMKTFEANGAELARTFVLTRGFTADRAEKIATAILLHAGHANGEGPDIEFVMVGAGQDVLGPSQEQLSDDELAATERAIPRLDFRAQFLALLKDHVKRTKNPTWTEDFVRNPWPNFLQNRWSQ